MSAWKKLKQLFVTEDGTEVQNGFERNSFSGLLQNLTGEQDAAGDVRSFEQLQADLVQMFSARPMVAHERLFILSLSEIRLRLGDRWAAAHSSILKLCDTATKRHLGKGDIAIKYGGDCLVMFLRGDPREARRRAQLVTEEVLSTIVGEDSGMVEHCLCYAFVDPQNAITFRTVDALDPLKQVLTEGMPYSSARAAMERPVAGTRMPGGQPAAAPLPAAPAETGARLDVFQGLEDRLMARLGQNFSPEERARQLAANLGKIEGEAFVPLTTPVLGQRFAEAMAADAAPRSAPASFLDSVPRVSSESDLGFFPPINPAPRAGETIGSPAVKSGPGVGGPQVSTGATLSTGQQIDYHFIPAWHATKQVVSAYWFELMVAEGGVLLAPSEILPPDSDPALVAMIDRVVLLSALAALRTSLAQNLRSVVCVPVHHTTLNATTRLQNYLSICRMASAEMRRFIVWELVGAPAGVWQSQIAPVIAALKPYGRAVLLRDSLEDVNLSSLKGMGVFGVGGALNDYQQKEAVITRKIEKFIERANEAGLRTYLRHCPTVSLASVAVSAGVDYIDGPIIAEPVNELRGIRRFEVRDLYAPPAS
ncbi:MAG: hypothetical protein KJ904_14060 [Alphaproteobacteria bacterium]|nr:hypothetical protein [Alphaproteobacteria bacterium]MBU0796758.1 hypothetical protein [Alphaproteobacteria bacterium]MBU0888278.1 hypothetical protein [Alphaproteobacteria bacterium]MBU1811479.1 hypothetical protein [Alphaproteobacteria bacterium]MBU2089546.1 hypothetical protein [Alphaproteobacteria bacterium]